MLPILISLVPTLIAEAENIFSKSDDNQKRGPEKKTWVLNMVKKFHKKINHLEPKWMDFDDELDEIISTVIEIALKKVEV